MHQEFEATFKTLNKRADGGRIVITTSDIDRDNDRVFARGARTDKYLANPVVLWAHQYGQTGPWNVVGRTTNLSVEPERIIADFELRPSTSEHDPQTIVRQLWQEGYIKTASVGFIPLRTESNNAGGTDHLEWEMLEWSLVPVPAQAAALALAMKQKQARRQRGETRAAALTAMQLCVGLMRTPEYRQATEQSQVQLLNNWVTLARLALT